MSAPVLTRPLISDVQPGGARPSIITDTSGGTLYLVVVARNDPAPSAAQIKAGQNSAGSSALFAAQQVVSAVGTQTLPAITGLKAGTPYDCWFMHEAGATGGGGAAPADIAYNDFESGTLTGSVGTFHFPYAGTMDFPADPTGSGRGKILRLHYAPTAGNLSDDEGILPFPVTNIRYGQTRWAKFDIYFPSATRTPFNAAYANDNRKIIYWQGDAGTGNGPSCQLILHRKLSVNGLEVFMAADDWMGRTSIHEVMDVATGILIPDDTWVTLEIKMITNSADNVRDGRVEIYKNNPGNTPDFVQASNLGWITEAYPGGSFFHDMLFGEQLSADQYPTLPLYTEDRYLDKVGFSTTRIV